MTLLPLVKFAGKVAKVSDMTCKFSHERQSHGLLEEEEACVVEEHAGRSSDLRPSGINGGRSTDTEVDEEDTHKNASTD